MSATTVRYRTLVAMDLLNQAINFAESGTMGHRVQVAMSVNDLNKFFVWSRPAGSSRAVGHFVANPSATSSFVNSLVATLSNVYNDVDGVSNGLNFSSAILDANTDPRIRLNSSVSANDLVMAYVLYMCYGNSSATTMNVIYNLQDAQGMLTSAGMTNAILNSLNAEESNSNANGDDKGAVDAMFRDLLAADPMRFFTANGQQIPGLFETNVDHDSNGTWMLVENDKIEFRVQFRFQQAVTRRGVGDPTQAMTESPNNEDSDTIVIAAGSTFLIRLQITATDTQAGAAEKAAAASAASAAALAQRVAATQTAAANAATALSAATAAQAAAALQTTNANAAYTSAVNTSAAQATAASNALAAAQAAQARLNAAIASGSTQEDIQTQRAAAVAAQAASDNATAIASAASAALQNAKNAQAAAQASLSAAQAQAAAAKASVATANAAAAAASLAQSNAQAEAQAAAAAVATAASDPIVTALTAAEKVILDPQTVITAQAKANTADDVALEAFNKSTASKSASNVATAAYDAAMTALNNAISAGGTLSSIQILRATAVSSQAAAEAASALATSDMAKLVTAQSSSIAAWQIAGNASAQAFGLKLTIANQTVNQDQRDLSGCKARTALALAANNAAIAAVTAAQNTLSAAVTAGAVAQEVQVKQQAVITTQATAAAALVTYNNAVAAQVAAQTKFDADTVAAAAASVAVTRDANTTSAKMAALNASRASSNTYQAGVVTQANVNQAAQKLNSLQQAQVQAYETYLDASASMIVAYDALNTAINAGQTVAQISALQNAASTAAAYVQQTNAALTAAKLAYQLNYQTVLVNADASGILHAASSLALINISNARSNNLIIAYTTAYANYRTLYAAANQAAVASALAQEKLNNAVSGGKTLQEITVLQDAATAAAAASATAAQQANYAKSAQEASLGAALGNLGAKAILDAMYATNISASNTAYKNALVKELNDGYLGATNASQNLLVAEYTQQVTESAVVDATNSGKTPQEIRDLQNVAVAAAKETAKAKIADTYARAQLANAIADISGGRAPVADVDSPWAATLTGSLWTSSGWKADMSGSAILAAQQAAQATYAASAKTNSLVQAYMITLASRDAAQTAMRQAQNTYTAAVSALNVAITQGANITEIQTLRTNVQDASAALASATGQYNYAVTAVNAAQGAASANAGAVTILTLSVTAQQTALASALANQLVAEYLRALLTSNEATIAYNTAVSNGVVANRALDNAITSGATIDQIQSLRLAAQAAASVVSSTLQTKEQATAGATVAKGNLNANPNAVAILNQSQADQAAAVSGAQSNALAQQLYAAQAASQAANATMVSTQAAYDAAAAALDNAITAGATIDQLQGLRAAAVQAGLVAAQAKSAADSAALTVVQAQQGVNADPNAVAIMQQNLQYQAVSIALAKSNQMIAYYNEATVAAGVAATALANAHEASVIATNALNDAITAGADIASIQSLRNASVAAASAEAVAQANSNAATAAMEQAQSNANIDPYARQILSASTIYKKLYNAQATANRSLINLNLHITDASGAKAKAALDLSASLVAQTDLTRAIANGLTVQEISNLQLAYNAAAALAAESRLLANAAVAQVAADRVTLQVDVSGWSAIAQPNVNLTLAAYKVDLVGSFPFSSPITNLYQAVNTLQLNTVVDIAGVIKSLAGVTQIANNYRTIYVNNNAALTKVLTTSPATPTSNVMVGLSVIGTGISQNDTKIVSAEVVTVLPDGSSANAVAITFNKPVSTGDNRFYIVGGVPVITV